VVVSVSAESILSSLLASSEAVSSRFSSSGPPDIEEYVFAVLFEMR
jgi:hypothetical protein